MEVSDTHQADDAGESTRALARRCRYINGAVLDGDTAGKTVAADARHTSAAASVDGSAQAAGGADVGDKRVAVGRRAAGSCTHFRVGEDTADKG